MAKLRPSPSAFSRLPSVITSMLASRTTPLSSLNPRKSPPPTSYTMCALTPCVLSKTHTSTSKTTSSPSTLKTGTCASSPADGTTSFAWRQISPPWVTPKRRKAVPKLDIFVKHAARRTVFLVGTTLTGNKWNNSTNRPNKLMSLELGRRQGCSSNRGSCQGKPRWLHSCLNVAEMHARLEQVHKTIRYPLNIFKLLTTTGLLFHFFIPYFTTR